MNDKQEIILHLGSNIGTKIQYINIAIAYLESYLGPKISQSQYWATEPWGNKNQKWFVNVAINFKTNILPLQILDFIQEIELFLGKNKKEHWGSRTIDIDIIYYGNYKIESDTLNIPHLYYKQRKFVSIPVNQLISHFKIELEQEDDTEMFEILDYKIVASSALFPSINFFNYINFIGLEHVVLSDKINLEKQNHVNRIQISGANKVLTETIPIKHPLPKSINDIQICYKHQWQKKTWRSIESSYKKTPYFDHYEHVIKSFYVNIDDIYLIDTIKKSFQIIDSIYHNNYSNSINQSLEHSNWVEFCNLNLLSKMYIKPYHQNFIDKFGFINHLSILDYLFNMGKKF